MLVDGKWISKWQPVETIDDQGGFVRPPTPRTTSWSFGATLTPLRSKPPTTAPSTLTTRSGWISVVSTRRSQLPVSRSLRPAFPAAASSFSPGPFPPLAT